MLELTCVDVRDSLNHDAGMISLPEVSIYIKNNKTIDKIMK